MESLSKIIYDGSSTWIPGNPSLNRLYHGSIIINLRCKAKERSKSLLFSNLNKLAISSRIAFPLESSITDFTKLVYFIK